MLLGIFLAGIKASSDEALINQINGIFGGLTSIFMYGSMVLAGLIAALEYAIYNGPSGYNPLI